MDGRQGHEPGDTVAANSMRPIYSKRAVVILTLPEFTRTASGFRLPAFLLGADRPGVLPGGGLCGDGLSMNTVATSRMCRGNRVHGSR